MKQICLLTVLFFLIPVGGYCGPLPEGQDVYADLRKNPQFDRLLTTWQELLGTGDQPLYDPEKRRKAEWLRLHRAELAPVLVEIARRDPDFNIRADAVSSCVYPSMDKTKMLGLIRENLSSWFGNLSDEHGLETPFLWSCCGYLGNFGDESDIALLQKLADAKNPEKSGWAEIAADRLVFLRKRLAREERARAVAGNATGSPPRRSPPQDKPALPPRQTAQPREPSAPAWKTPAAAALALLLLGLFFAFRTRLRRKDHDPHGKED